MGHRYGESSGRWTLSLCADGSGSPAGDRPASIARYGTPRLAKVRIRVRALGVPDHALIAHGHGNPPRLRGGLPLSYTYPVLALVTSPWRRNGGWSEKPGAEGLAQGIGRLISPGWSLGVRHGEGSLRLQPLEEISVPRVRPNICKPRHKSPEEELEAVEPNHLVDPVKTVV